MWLNRIGPGLLLAGMLAVAGGADMTLADSFDAAVWKAHRSDNSVDNPRKGMLSAVEKMLKPGMSRVEITAMLGEPEFTQGNRFVYGFGRPAFGPDMSWFVVEFGADGRLVRHFVERG